MAFFLFVDESGQDRRDSPYEVLGGISVEDRDLWNLVQALNNLEEQHFGLRYSREIDEIKARKFLKRKVFRLAGQMDPIEPTRRTELARECLLHGDRVTKEKLTALAQAKISFVSEALTLCRQYNCRIFASIVDPDSPIPSRDVLRKDYAYLFERFFYLLEDQDERSYGMVVFDELERSAANILIHQMEQYFIRTEHGRQRSTHVIPEPFFVHSDLTSLIQVADLIAYVISWGYRIRNQMTLPARSEFAALSQQIAEMRYRAIREMLGRERFYIWSLAYIEDLRGVDDREC